MQKYYQNEPKFNSVYTRNNWSKIKDGECKIILDEYESMGTHWIALYVHLKNVTYCDSSGVEHIAKLKAEKNSLEKKYYNKYF